MNRKLFDIIFDRPPERLDNGSCADCVFSGSRQLSGAWNYRLITPCNWHYRHSGPFGPDYTVKRSL